MFLSPNAGCCHGWRSAPVHRLTSPESLSLAQTLPPPDVKNFDRLPPIPDEKVVLLRGQKVGIEDAYLRPNPGVPGVGIQAVLTFVEFQPPPVWNLQLRFSVGMIPALFK